MCAMIEKLRIRSAGNDMRGCALVSVIRAAGRPLDRRAARTYVTACDGSTRQPRMVLRLRLLGGPTTLLQMANLTKLVGLSVVLVALVACKGKKQVKSPLENLDTTVRAVDPTLCDTNGKNVVTFDLNKDN